MIGYIDGSCRKNPGPGGFGVVIMDDKKEKVLYCHSKISEKDTTNNEQELLAACYALARYGKEKEPMTFYCDSSYTINTLTNWMFNWEKNGWIKSDKKKPENLDIIKFYFILWQQGNRIELKKIKGHAGILGNEIADKLAKGELTVDKCVEIYG